MSKSLESRCRVQNLYVQSIMAFKWEDMCLSSNSLQQPVDNNLQSNQRNITLANGNSKKSTEDAVMRIRKNQQQLNFALVKRIKFTITRSCKTYVEEKLVLRTNSLIKKRSLKPVNSTASTAVWNLWIQLQLSFAIIEKSGLDFHFPLLHKINKCNILGVW